MTTDTNRVLKTATCPSLSGKTTLTYEIGANGAEILALIDLLRAHPAALIGVTTFEVAHGPTRSFLVTTNADSTADLFGDSALRTVDLADVLREQFDGLAVLESASITR